MSNISVEQNSNLNDILVDRELGKSATLLFVIFYSMKFYDKQRFSLVNLENI